MRSTGVARQAKEAPWQIPYADRAVASWPGAIIARILLPRPRFQDEPRAFLRHLEESDPGVIRV